MLGQEIKSGTGSVDLMFDEKMYIQNEENLEDAYELKQSSEEPSAVTLDACNIQNIQNNIHMYVQKEDIVQPVHIEVEFVD